jgi:hypothetical protein
MKKVLVYILLLCILPGASQLFKLPGLIMHFEQHKTESITPLSFTEFLYEHYLDTNNQNDVAHKNLPFKQINVSAFVCLINPTIAVFAIPTNTNEESVAYGIIRTQHTSSCTLSIWQPPRIS